MLRGLLLVQQQIQEDESEKDGWVGGDMPTRRSMAKRSDPSISGQDGSRSPEE
jgi:hypothetical protein